MTSAPTHLKYELDHQHGFYFEKYSPKGDATPATIRDVHFNVNEEEYQRFLTRYLEAPDDRHRRQLLENDGVDTERFESRIPVSARDPAILTCEKLRPYGVSLSQPDRSRSVVRHMILQWYRGHEGYPPEDVRYNAIEDDSESEEKEAPSSPPLTSGTTEDPPESTNTTTVAELPCTAYVDKTVHGIQNLENHDTDTYEPVFRLGTLWGEDEHIGSAW